MANEALYEWLKNGQMAALNPDLLREAAASVRLDKGARGGTYVVEGETQTDEAPQASEAEVGPSEYQVQKAIFEWAAYRANQVPDLELLYAVPNGQYREGQRMEAGLRKGMVDYVLPVPRDKYHGAYFELKVDDNQTSTEQDWWIARLREQGYFVMEVRGFDHAKAALEWYLSLDPVR